MTENEREWVIEPNTARIEISIGNDAAISPDLRAALEQLAQVMAQEDEVSGYMIRVDCHDVTTTMCDINLKCSAVTYTHTDP
jgi:hypothetical protein